MKILFTPMAASSLAHMARLFEIAEEMQERGHEILFTSSYDRADFILNSGFPVYEVYYEPINFNDPKDQSLNYIRSNRQYFKEWFDLEIKAAEVFDADLVITSPGFLGPHVTYKTGIPTVAILNAPYLAESVGILGLSLTEDTRRNKALRSLLKPMFERKFTHMYLHEVLEIYKELEIEFLGGTRRDLYDGMDIIIPSIPELEPIDDIKKYLYSGPLFWRGFENKYEFDEEAILRFRDDRQLIYLSFGGSIFNVDFYKHFLSFIGKLPYAFVVSTGPNVNTKELKYNHKNTKIYNFLPGLKMCEIADVVVNTGSHGTIMQALKCGKPLICFPCNIDQSFFAYRVEELGVGININKTSILRFTQRESYYKLNESLPRNLEKSIDQVLTQPKYRKNAGSLSEVIQGFGDSAKKICDYVEYKYAS